MRFGRVRSPMASGVKSFAAVRAGSVTVLALVQATGLEMVGIARLAVTCALCFVPTDNEE
jgi:hypothetical protein